MAVDANTRRRKPRQTGSWLHKLGAGLITGAADDDPSGIATYSQSGAQFGFGTLWTVFLTTPLMIAIQVSCARIGVVTGRGLAANMRQHFPRPLTLTLATLLLLANTINIAADLAAMSEALGILIGGPKQAYALAFGLICLWMETAVPFERYVRILKWLTLSLLTYVGIVFTVSIPWIEVARSAVLPKLRFDGDYLTTVVAILGTTISPYLFFWQTAQEVAEQNLDASRAPLRKAPYLAHDELRRIKFDTVIGMTFSNAIALFIMITTAVTLHAHGIFTIDTTREAAEALRPIAGDFAFALFSLGIIGTGLLAIPVLAGSAAHAGAEALDRPGGASKRTIATREYFTIIVIATLGGTALTFAPIDPIRLLYWAAVINGVIAVPIMVATVSMASSRKIMKQFTISPRLRIFAWAAVAVVALAVIGMLLQKLS